jgi:ABC-2 type transport system permease protein
MLFMLLGLVLGGFIFPRYLMPPVIRVLGNLFPLTYFIPIARGIITKGIGIEHLWKQLAALVVYVVVVLFISARAFRQGLD